MTGVELIVAALAAGASAGVTNTAAAAFQDAYTHFKGVLARRLSGRTAARPALDAEVTQPEQWRLLLGEELQQSGAAFDAEVLEAARRLLSVLNPPAVMHDVDLRDARGVQVGNQNIQINTFG